MAIGGILVAGLVGWALTRSVEPSSGYLATTEAPAATATPLDTAATTAPPVTPPTATAADPHDAVPRISVADLRELHSRGAVTIIDVRDDIGYSTSHIPGSLHIPMARVEMEAPNIPKDKPIVTYCT